MAMKDFDFKKFMREKGERAALIGTGAVALLTLIIGLVMSIRANSPAANAKMIQGPTDALSNALKDGPGGNQPTDADKPSQAQLSQVVESFKINSIDLAARYHSADLFAAAPPVDDRRGQPTVLKPSEGKAAVVLAQVKSYSFNDTYTSVWVLKDTNLKKDQTHYSFSGYTGMRGGPGAMPRMPGRPPAGYDSRFASASDVTGVESQKKKALPKSLVPLKDLDKKENLEQRRLAEQTRPVRMAVIYASFPYEDELKQFRDKVYGGKASLAEVTNDTVVEDEPLKEGEGTRKVERPAFRFTEVEMQRRLVDATGRPIDRKTGLPLDDPNGGWEGTDEKGNPVPGKSLDLRSKYRWFLFLVGKRTQPESEKMVPALKPGLWMPRLPLMGEGQYPDDDWVKKEELKDKMPKLSKALTDYDPQTDTATGPSQFSTGDFDVFGGETGTTTGPGGPGDMGTTTTPRTTPKTTPPMPKSGTTTTTGPRGTGPGYGQPDVKPIEYALIRLVDVDIEPGRIYEYRIRVHMANPNYGKLKEVADPTFADGVELPPGPWYNIPQKVVVPQELQIYAVNQSGKTPERGAVAMQIHRWIDVLTLDKQNYFIGEWSVADRVEVFKGEAVDRTQRVEVPVWDSSLEDFVLLGLPDDKRKQAGVEVPFGNPARPSVLVDFEGGRVSYAHKGAGTVDDQEREEVLVLSPDGRLMSHNSKADQDDKQRKDRYDAWKRRLKEVRDQTRSAGGGTGKTTDPGLNK